MPRGRARPRGAREGARRAARAVRVRALGGPPREGGEDGGAEEGSGRVRGGEDADVARDAWVDGKAGHREGGADFGEGLAGGEDRFRFLPRAVHAARFLPVGC